MQILNKELCGLIHDYYPRERMISIEVRGRIMYFQFPKRTHRYFEEAMFYPLVFVDFVYEDSIKIIKKVPARHISDVKKIFYRKGRRLIELYSRNETQEEIREIINKPGYKMFIDLELTMPKWGYNHPFSPEILQIGCVVLNENDEIVNYYDNYVKTVKPITDRTFRFLSLGEEAVTEAIDYEQFYNDYKHLIDIYNPIVYVWGGNDVVSLKKSYELHKLPEIKVEYQDLLQLHHKYFELKYDISLFNALRIYRGIEATQVHHALTDAQATKEVYDGFKKHVNGIELFDVKGLQQKYMNEEKEAY
jgi:inhibitor of KinA sporulation pathway (predicted exonuclease)